VKVSQRLTLITAGVVALLAAMAGQQAVAGPPGGSAGAFTTMQLPRPDHVVVVIEENRSYDAVIGNSQAPYINSLASRGALFSNAFAVGHPSEPNSLALFSGSTQGVTDDSCPHVFKGPNLASELVRSGHTFGIYSESLPAVGFTGCHSGPYDRKHNPAVNWQETNFPMPNNMPFALFTIVPGDYEQLPTVAFVVPNEDHNMHDGSVAKADEWLQKHLDGYVRWATTHNSLLIVTWDEGRGQDHNRIATIFVGPMVKPGVYSQRIDHYSVLRTVAQMYRLRPLGRSVQAAPVREIWRTGLARQD